MRTSPIVLPMRVLFKERKHEGHCGSFSKMKKDSADVVAQTEHLQRLGWQQLPCLDQHLLATHHYYSNFIGSELLVL